MWKDAAYEVPFIADKRVLEGVPTESYSYELLKRIMDCIGSGIGLLLLSPLFLLMAILIKRESAGPV
jgi:lipopolysaccharide/colanic/teichoic acid biosynthesis glycosyltransferase